jgi:hypothetical protein
MVTVVKHYRTWITVVVVALALALAGWVLADSAPQQAPPAAPATASR